MWPFKKKKYGLDVDTGLAAIDGNQHRLTSWLIAEELGIPEIIGTQSEEAHFKILKRIREMNVEIAELKKREEK